MTPDVSRTSLRSHHHEISQVLQVATSWVCIEELIHWYSEYMEVHVDWLVYIMVHDQLYCVIHV